MFSRSPQLSITCEKKSKKFQNLARFEREQKIELLCFQSGLLYRCVDSKCILIYEKKRDFKFTPPFGEIVRSVWIIRIYHISTKYVFFQVNFLIDIFGISLQAEFDWRDRIEKDNPDSLITNMR